MFMVAHKVITNLVVNIILFVIIYIQLNDNNLSE